MTNDGEDFPITTPRYHCLALGDDNHAFLNPPPSGYILHLELDPEGMCALSLCHTAACVLCVAFVLGKPPIRSRVRNMRLQV